MRSRVVAPLLVLSLAACHEGPPPVESDTPVAELTAVPESLPMGGERSVMSFFVSSVTEVAVFPARAG